MCNCFLYFLITSFCFSFFSSLSFPGGSAVKNPSVKKETRVLSLGQEDPLQKETANHSSILAWKIICIEEPGGLQSPGLQKNQTQT